MKTTTYALRTSMRSPREIAIHRLVHFIRTGDLRSARNVLERFEKRGERVSREIAVAYDRLFP
jgi:hypothetical protein